MTVVYNERDRQLLYRLAVLDSGKGLSLTWLHHLDRRGWVNVQCRLASTKKGKRIVAMWSVTRLGVRELARWKLSQ